MIKNIKIGNIKIVRYFLNKECDIIKCLDYDFFSDHTKIAKLLLNISANIREYNNRALSWYSIRGITGIIKLLLNYEANVHFNDNIALQFSVKKWTF